MSDAAGAWGRVAATRPRLRPELDTAPHRYRGQDWQVLHDPLGGRAHRMPLAAWRFASLLDGERRACDALEAARERLGDAAPGPEEAAEILGRLTAAGLTTEGPGDPRPAPAGLRKALANPLSVRIPLFDPDRMLRALVPLARPLFGPLGLVAWLALVVAGAAAAVVSWPELAAHFRSQSLAPATVALVGAAYVAMKALHELAHGLATRRWGGTVHEVGVQLLVLLPLPYVDASASTVFSDRGRRIVVCAAGIAVELALAAAAVLLWTWSEPGLVRDLALNVAVIGSVSTLLFNGNPLLRFDGYHVLAELLEIPGLGTRSARFWRRLAARHLLGARAGPSPVCAPGETPWLAVYGLAAGVYRWVVAFAIIWFVSGAYPVVGLVLAVWAAATLVGTPVVQLARFLASSPALEGGRGPALARAAACAALVGVSLFVLPLPYASRAEGVVWPAEDAQVRAEADGFVVDVLVEPGQRVGAGDLLVRLDAPIVGARLEVLAARRAELEAELAVEAFGDVARAATLRDAIAAVEAEQALARSRQSRMDVTSPVDGVFVPVAARELRGLHLRQGEPIGLVVEDGATLVRAALDQHAAGLLRERPGAVAARFADDLGRVVEARLLEEVPAARTELASAVLGTAGGGRIPVDRADEAGLRTLAPVFDVVLEVIRPAGAAPLGQRVHLRFDHGAAPLASQWWRAVRQLFLGRIAV